MLSGIPCRRVGYHTRRNCVALGELYGDPNDEKYDKVYSVIPAAAEVTDATVCPRWYAEYDRLPQSPLE
jgi:hypothetical protein